MYSTKLRNNRYNIMCLAVFNNISKLVMCVDTGAMYTCCSYNDIDENLCESDFGDSDCKYLGGFVEGTAMKFYRYKLKQFTVGNIDLGSQDIWITFDDRVSDSVVGVDILSKVTFLHIKDSSKLLFFSSVEELYNFGKEADI